MPKSYKLVIVESPGKIKTIEKYLGNTYKVVSSYGHIRDLPRKELAIDLTNGFKPTYVIDKQKLSLVAELKKWTGKATEVLLATDDDREGEAISWHLKESLALSDQKIKRIVFREITQKAILNALKHPRSIDMDLVNAQQARRILDRLVGYKASPVLWKKIKSGLSAGRVQSVAVKFIVERERAIYSFVPKASFKVIANFSLASGEQLQGELTERLKDYKQAYKFLETCIKATFSITAIKKSTIERSPAPPLITATLQQAASQRLGYSVSQTMVLAQRLYEQGHITYMRTDSVNLSTEALTQAKKAIVATYGAPYHAQRVYKTKSATAQEAHEAIRPTLFEQKIVSKDKSIQRLYTLIWQRSIASQMAVATFDKTSATIGISTAPQILVAKGEILTFKGFLAAYGQGNDNNTLKVLPPLKVGQTLSLAKMQASERFTKPPARYTEATLVKYLKEQNIGRPSTYAPIISTIQQRGYIIKESRPGKERTYQTITLEQGTLQAKKETETVGSEKNKLFPTDIAFIVNDFLVAHFPNITNHNFTAHIETQLDEIAQKKQNWQAMLGSFYQKFSPKVDKATGVATDEVSTMRTLGKDPKTGKPVIARLSRRYGPLVQIGGMDDEVKPRFASLRKGQFIEKITLEEALPLFSLPREVGTFEQAPIVVQIGRYGPYIKHQDKFYSLAKEFDPYKIDQAQAIEIIKTKQIEEAKKIIKAFDKDPTIQIRNGKWGPYIKTPNRNIKIPKNKEPAELTLENCLELIAQAPTKRRFATRTKKEKKRN